MSEKMWDKAYTMDLSEECYVMSQEKTVKPAKAQGSVLHTLHIQSSATFPFLG